MLEVRNLSVTYNKNGILTRAVENVSFSLKELSFSGLIGESGSGKSTVIMAILGLLPEGTEISGHIYFEGVDILALKEDELRSMRGKNIALVPQGALNSFTPVMTIGRHIAEVLYVHSGVSAASADGKIKELLHEVGLEENIGGRYPHELSGGQKQRAAIALALACSPSLLLADEPTTALDVIIQSEIITLLEEMRDKKGLTILLVTHDLPLAASFCDSLFVMKDAELVESGEPSDVIFSPKHHHTKDLVEAMLQ